MIKLKITKFDKNEKYDEQLQKWGCTATSPLSIGNMDRPYPDKVGSVLEVELTEDQWSAIRKAVMEAF